MATAILQVPIASASLAGLDRTAPHRGALLAAIAVAGALQMASANVTHPMVVWRANGSPSKNPMRSSPLKLGSCLLHLLSYPLPRAGHHHRRRSSPSCRLRLLCHCCYRRCHHCQSLCSLRHHIPSPCPLLCPLYCPCSHRRVFWHSPPRLPTRPDTAPILCIAPWVAATGSAAGAYAIVWQAGQVLHVRCLSQPLPCSFLTNRWTIETYTSRFLYRLTLHLPYSTVGLSQWA
mmetsp:Transcript_37791/g.99948  ORF Transcript_37791/g.99948 Transcript_37791/m.99948 type:complete len:233 (-) Transcript_37791:17-715(-)